jgi:hypothetical protein
MGRKESVLEQSIRLRKEGEEKRALIEAARAQTRMIDIESGDPACDITTKAPFRVIDDFLAVVDGREDLAQAMKLARNLLHDFEAVTVIRDRSEKDIAKSYRAMSASFDKDMFGSGPKEAFIFPRPDRNKYMVYRPTMLSSKQYTHKQFGFFARCSFGADIDDFARAAGEAFPEYLNTTVKRNSADNGSSKPGWVHTDGPYNVEETLKHYYLDPKFLKDKEAEQIDVLPGEATITMVLNDREGESDKLDPLGGAGTILINSRAGLCGEFFHGADDTIGYQAYDGDIVVMRGEGWPDHPVTGEPRAAANHAAALDNKYGVPNHAGRMIALATSKVCYVHPRVRDLIEPAA